MSIVKVERNRPARTTATQRVNCTLRELLDQGAFRRLELGKARAGRVTNRIFWHHDRSYRFILDFDASAVAMPALMRATPQLVRELQGPMRPTSGLVLDGLATLDPSKGELRVFSLRGSLTLSVTVLNNAFEYCTEYLIHLAGAAVRSGWTRDA
ncbi:hypothetical protein [Steroidobacter cummioxidans]|uniref:hypothetical protein n=1 Tax=Steroidobacter cummioxidans TaxID=1803913 RepID=UPI00129045A6|nr:hypothetical protein [Steroidobacter cummioxidans]